MESCEAFSENGKDTGEEETIMSRVITISREFGSGGREVGFRLAEKLGIPFYDKEIISMAAEEIEKVIEPIADVSVANYNCPGQIVITGKTDAVEEAAAKLKEAGARRTIMLNVSGPFHSQMLVPAGEKLAEELEHTRFHELRIPYVTNVTAEKVTDIRETPGLLTTQISSPVRWMQSMERMIADGVDTFVEIGPGKTLEGFLRKIDRSVKVFHISQWEDVDKVCTELADSGKMMEEA